MSLTGIITSNEPRAIKRLFGELIECPMNYDFCLLTNQGKVGIERKKVPQDLIASVEDGRLGREILAMREECQIMVILLHGKMRFNSNGTLSMGKRTSYHWTRKSIQNLLRTIEYVEGCYIEEAGTSQELVNVIQDLQEYFDKDRHNSTKGRTPINSNWIKPAYHERVRYWMDGLPGIGTRGAVLLTDRFKTPMALFQASIDEICETPRVGKVVATNIYNFLRGIEQKT